MFVCLSCVKDYYILVAGKWVLSPDGLTPSSIGRCENCGEIKPCLDVPHNHYAHKDSTYAKEYIH